MDSKGLPYYLDIIWDKDVHPFPPPPIPNRDLQRHQNHDQMQYMQNSRICLLLMGIIQSPGINLLSMRMTVYMMLYQKASTRILYLHYLTRKWCHLEAQFTMNCGVFQNKYGLSVKGNSELASTAIH